mgnify:CR=1 FL=1
MNAILTAVPASEPDAATSAITLSIVTPAFREAKNLPTLYARLCMTLDSAGVGWEWVVVDDH